MLFSIAPVQARDYFHLAPPRLAVDLRYDFRDEFRLTRYAQQSLVEHKYTEHFEIGSSGWVYAPQLLTYEFDIIPELQQGRSEINDQADSYSNVLEGYRSSIHILKDKPVSLYLSGRRDKTSIDASFFRTTETQTEDYYSTLFWKSKFFPLSVTVSQEQKDQKGFFNSYEKTHLYSFGGRQPDTRTDLSISRKETLREFSNATKQIYATDGRVSNFSNLNQSDTVGLSSSLSYRAFEDHQKNTTTNINLREVLGWQHRKNLRSDYNFGYLKSDADNFSHEVKSFSAGVQHKLYQNLTTKASAYSSFSDSTSGETNVYRGGLTFDYIRPLPWGTINIQIGHQYAKTTRLFTSVYGFVSDETVRMSSIDLVFLEQELVDALSIQVTDAGGGPLVEGSDYILSKIGTLTRIALNPLSPNIAEGDTVSVNYRYQNTPNYDDAVFFRTYALGLDLWESLKLSYRYSHSEQELLSGLTLLPLVEDTTHETKAELTIGSSATSATYIDRESSSRVSTRTWTVSEQLTFRLSKQFFLRALGLYGERLYREMDADETFTRLSIGVDWIPKAAYNFKLDAKQNTTSGTFNKTAEAGLSGVFEIYLGFWKGSIGYSYYDQKDDLLEMERRIHNFKVELLRKQF